MPEFKRDFVMSGEEDDKPTVVLDLDALKKELQQKENELSDIASDISFNLDEESEENNISETPIILFDFQSTFFKENQDDLPLGFDYKIVTELKELNLLMQERTPSIVVFNYSAYPKACNQLTVQIKEKFPFIKIVLAAKNLSMQKAQEHKLSRAGAHAYLAIPIEKQLFEEIIRDLDQQ